MICNMRIVVQTIVYLENKMNWHAVMTIQVNLILGSGRAWWDSFVLSSCKTAMGILI